MKNVASTSVLRWGGGVLCLWEGGEPYELHPRMLETLGLGPFDILGLGAGGAAPDGDAAARHRRRRPWLQEAAIDVAARLLRPVLSGLYRHHLGVRLAHQTGPDVCARAWLPQVSSACRPGGCWRTTRSTPGGTGC